MNRKYLVPLICAFGLLFVFILNLKPSDAFAAGTIYDANTMYESGAIAATGGSITCVSNNLYHNGNYLLFTPSDVTEANKNNHYIEFKINIPVSGNYDIYGDFFSCSNGGTYELSINGICIGDISLNNSTPSFLTKAFTETNGIGLSKGENTFRIYLKDITYGTLCGFDDIVLTNKAPQSLETPTGLSWDSMKAQWTADSNASKYRLQLYKDGNAVGSFITVFSGSAYDFAAIMAENGSGKYTFDVTAIGDGNYFTDSSSATETNGYDYYVPVKLTSDTILPDATVNSPYSFSFSSSGGKGSKSYSYSSLPNELNVSNSGLLSGTMQSEGTYIFTVFITDGRSTDSKDYQLTVNRQATLIKAVADGNTDTATSHYIDLTFDQSITGLTNNNITLTNGTGTAVKGDLSGSGKNWRINLSKVTVQGNISLNITSPNLFVISGSPVTVAVYKYKPSNNASLSDLKIGANTVSGFAADQYGYNLELPYGTKPGDAAAKISAVTADAKATATIIQADHFPGDAIVTVTAEDTTSVHNYTIHLSAAADTAPVRKAGVTDQTTADVTVNQAYTLKLTDIFRDVNSMDTLTYQVSVNGAAYIPAAENYSYIPTLPGQTTLKFIANDGTMDSSDTYTVTLNASKPKYMLTITAGSGGSIVTGANGNYEAGAIITISANTLANYSFAGWTSSDGGSFGDKNSSTTTFVMPAHPVTVMAAFTPYQPIALVKAVADGNKDTATSTCINLTFDQSITGLTKNDLTLTDGTGAAVKGELSGSGKAWSLRLSQVTLQGNITLNITSPAGYVISGFPAVLSVYKYKPSNNASLSDLKIGGNTVSGFAADQYGYNLELPYGTKPGDAAAKISAVTADAKATVTVTQADHFPGDAIVTVTAEDTNTVHKYTIHLSVAADTAPERKAGVPDHTTADITVNQAYTLKLSDIFRDANSIDTLTYQVSVNGAANIPAAENYSYIPALPGQTTLKFIANDGTMNSTDTYTVALNAAKPKYKLTITAGSGGSIVTGADGNYEAGAIITISANALANYSFAGWTSSDGSFGNSNSSTTTFVMPAHPVTVMAAFTPYQPIALVKAVADGNKDTANSTCINLTFDQSITGLTKNDITLTDGTGAAVKGELSGSGKAWSLSLSQVSVQGNITLNITSPTGYVLSGFPAVLSVYKYKPSNNASLSDLKIGGNTVSGFAADQYGYNLELPYGTKPGDAAAKISAVTADSKATVTVTQADHFPGDAIVMVTAEDTTTVHNYTIHLSVAADTAPVRKTGVTDQTTADVIVNQAYALKLSDIFMDVNSIDTLTYQVSVNGAAYIPAAENYSYIPTLPGQTTLKFIANDGTMNSTDTYTVTLNVAKPKYKLTITAGSGGSIVTGTDGNYEAGAIITISANALANYSFAGWTSSDGGSFGNSNSSTTTFVMPAHPVTVKAAFTSIIPSGNQSSSQAIDNILPDMNGNSIKGWNAIKEYLAESTTGNFTVDLNGSTGIPKDILTDIQGKNITLTLRLSDEMEWRINGKDIPASWQKETTGNTNEQENAGSDTKSSADFNVQIALDTHHISDDLISGLTSDGETARQLSLSYEGSFGFPALLHINLEQKNKGKTVYLYYYNPSTKKLELQSIGQIDEEGNTELSFHHASDYVILMDDGKTLSKLEDQISATPSRKVLTIGGTKDNTAAFSIKYPQEIEKLIADDNCICSTIYTSSNPATVYVNSNGKVTARKKGKAIITTTININGVTKSLQSRITVKKAGLKPNKSLKQ